MSYNNVYYFDEKRLMLWVLPPKNASSSIKDTMGFTQWIGREKALELNKHHTIGVLRHPYERLVSALYTVHMECNDFAERLKKYAEDSHVRPQAPAFEGLRVDRWLRVENLAQQWPEDFPELRYVNEGSRRNGRPARWQDACDWSEFHPIYEKDMQLWSSGSRAHPAAARALLALA